MLLASQNCHPAATSLPGKRFRSFPYILKLINWWLPYLSANCHLTLPLFGRQFFHFSNHHPFTPNHQLSLMPAPSPTAPPPLLLTFPVHPAASTPFVLPLHRRARRRAAEVAWCLSALFLLIFFLCFHIYIIGMTLNWSQEARGECGILPAPRGSLSRPSLPCSGTPPFTTHLF